MKRTLSCVLLPLTLTLGLPALAQHAEPGSFPGQTKSTVLVPYGPYVTQMGVGAGGHDVSEIENGFATFGFLMDQGPPEWRVADDLTVPAGESWTVESVGFLAFQEGGSIMGSFTDIRVDIWDHDPLTGGKPLLSVPFNLLTSQLWTGVFRVDPSGSLTDNSRPIIELRADFSGFSVPPLSSGTYWFSCNALGSSLAGFSEATVQVPWNPTNNGRQYFEFSGWSAAVDSISGKEQGFLFQVEGTLAGGGGVSQFCSSKPSSLPGCVPTLDGTSSNLSKAAGAGSYNVSAEPAPGGPGKFGILIYTRNGLLASPTQTPFGDLCLKLFLRAGAFSTLPGGTPSQCDGVYLWDFGQIASVTPQVIVGDTLHVQAWYRDSLSVGSANFTNGIGPITVVP